MKDGVIALVNLMQAVPEWLRVLLLITIPVFFFTRLVLNYRKKDNNYVLLKQIENKLDKMEERYENDRKEFVKYDLFNRLEAHWGKMLEAFNLRLVRVEELFKSFKVEIKSKEKNWTYEKVDKGDHNA